MQIRTRTLAAVVAATLAVSAPATVRAQAAAGVAAAAPATSAAQSSRFAGQWELNAAKSDFGAAAAQAPSKVAMTVTQAGTALKVAQAITMAGRDLNVTSDYAITGQDVTANAPDGLPVTSNSKLAGDTLVIGSKLERQGMAIVQSSRWTLSPDAKTLTIVQSTEMMTNAMAMTLVFDRK